MNGLVTFFPAISGRVPTQGTFRAIMLLLAASYGSFRRDLDLWTFQYERALTMSANN